MTRFSARFNLPKLLCGALCATSGIGWSGRSGVAVHEHGHVLAVATDVDVLLLPRVCTAVGAGPAGFLAGVFRAVLRFLFLKQLPANGTGDPPVFVADEATELPQRLNLDANVTARIAVRQHPGMEAGLNVLRALGSLHLRP